MDTAVSNSAGTSTGAVSFMERFSNSTREVGQNNRRGALMCTIDINHPDVEQFATIKSDLTKVTGANISIKLNKEFMEAVEKGKDYILRFPCDIEIVDGSVEDIKYNKLYKNPTGDSYYKKVKAKELWNIITKQARDNAEPGLLMWDNTNDYSPASVYKQYKELGTNPCGEITLQPYDSCRLMVLNLFSFVKDPFTKQASIDYDLLYKMAYEQQRLMDNLVDLEVEAIDKIIAKIEKEELTINQTELELWQKIKETGLAGRRTGCGITALGDMLAALNIKYDSEEALKITDKVMNTKMEAELDCNIDLSILRSHFKGWQKELEFLTDVDNELCSGTNKFYQFILEKFPEQAERMYKYGRRSVSFSTIAPTGSVSILTQTTSGLEPLFQPYYIRRKKINHNETNSRVDFVDENGDNWQEYPVLHPKFKDWITSRVIENKTYSTFKELRELKEILENPDAVKEYFEQSPWYGSIANDIDWTKRLEIQEVLQKYTTHSISSTINLPEDTSLETVQKIYMEASKKGLKGVTIYRDGSRSGVLVSNTEKPKDTFKYIDAIKRPKELKAASHLTKVQGEEYNVVVGLLDDKPYEVFAFVGKQFNKGEGVLIKEKRGKYTYQSDTVHSLDIGNGMTDEQAALTRMISTSLRHGADIKFIVEQLNKADGELFSFTKAIARTLKKYIPDGTKSTVTCNDCGSNNVVFEEGCLSCKECGSSKCG